MKIRTRLTLLYTLATAVIFLLFISIIYLFTKKNREKEFYRDLRREAITKANLFFQEHVDAETMQFIYHNNRQFIDEVEVAIYNSDFHLLYHDAAEIDIVKETPEMINRILEKKDLELYEGKYQIVGLSYLYQGKEYVITAAAYDGYGFAKQENLGSLLILISLGGIVILSFTGYLLARSSLSPVSRIVEEVENITASNLHNRIEVGNEKDEIGELATNFNLMLDRLETSFDAQKMFVSNISHELRTPLAAMKGEVEIALFRDRSPEEYRQVLLNILSDTDKITKLSAGLLDLAKASDDTQQISMKPVRLDEILLDAREMVVKVNPDFTVQLLLKRKQRMIPGLQFMGTSIFCVQPLLI